MRSTFWLPGRGRGTLYRRHGNTDQHQRVLEYGIWGALTFCPCSSIAPLERHVLGFCALQGGGLYIYGTATLTNTNVYSNTASQVRARLSNLTRRFPPSPPFLHRARWIALSSPVSYFRVLLCTSPEQRTWDAPPLAALSSVQLLRSLAYRRHRCRPPPGAPLLLSSHLVRPDALSSCGVLLSSVAQTLTQTRSFLIVTLAPAVADVAGITSMPLVCGC